MSEASFSKCLMRYSYIHSVLAPLSKCCPHLEGRLLTRYSPVRHLVFTEINTPFDLHVLSTPPAFVLSQDQTLQDILELFASSFSFVVVDLHRRNFWFGSINGTRTLAMFISCEMITFTLFSFQRSDAVYAC